MTGCKQEFVCWPFKRAPVSLADSLEDRIPTDFHHQMFCGRLSPLGCSGLGSPAWV